MFIKTCVYASKYVYHEIVINRNSNNKKDQSKIRKWQIIHVENDDVVYEDNKIRKEYIFTYAYIKYWTKHDLLILVKTNAIKAIGGTLISGAVFLICERYVIE